MIKQALGKAKVYKQWYSLNKDKILKETTDPKSEVYIVHKGDKLSPTIGTYDESGDVKNTYSRMAIERDRMTVYENVDSLRDESPFGVISQNFIEEAFKVPPVIQFEKKKAEKIALGMLERMKYFRGNRRSGIMINTYDYGDNFQQLTFDVTHKGTVGIEEKYMNMPCNTIYVNIDHTNTFIDLNKAYSQKKSVSDRNGIDFPIYKILHTKYDQHRSKDPGYGRSGFYSSFPMYNLVMGMMRDLGIARHKNINGKHMVKFDTKENKDANSEQINKMVTAGYDLISAHGNVSVESLQNKTDLITKVDDVLLAIMFFDIGHESTLKLLGLGQNLSGEELARIEKKRANGIRRIYRLEEEMVLRPLIDLELFFNGIVHAEYRLKYPEHLSEDKNKLSKRLLSEVDANIISRGEYYKMIYGDEEPWVKDKQYNKMSIAEQIIYERENGFSTNNSSNDRPIDKGKKGVQKTPPEDQDSTEYDNDDYTNEQPKADVGSKGTSDE